MEGRIDPFRIEGGRIELRSGRKEVMERGKRRKRTVQLDPLLRHTLTPPFKEHWIDQCGLDAL
jgi:hypothetical protein